jgi:hypothetical protein
LSWTSSGAVTPISITLEVYEQWNDGGAGIPVVVNGSSDGTYGAFNSCAPTVLSIPLTPAFYNVGGSNSVELDYNAISGTVEIDENPAWSAGALARVVVNYPTSPIVPIALNDTLSEDSESTGNYLDVQGNDYDGNGDIMTTSIIYGPTSGGNAVVVNGDSIQYAPGTGFCGVDTIVYSVCDPGSLCDTAYVYITIVDIVDPVAVCQNVSVYLSSAGTASIAAADLDGGSTDNCSPLSLIADITAFDCTDIGSPVDVILTVTDSFSNSMACTATVTVLDTVSPVLASCPADMTMVANSSGCLGIASWVPPTSSDNCGSPVMTSSHDIGDTFAIGVTTVSYLLVDDSGNQDSCSFTVTITNGLSLTTVVTDETASSSNGSIDLTVTGAIGPAIYDWDNDGTGDNDDAEDLSGISSGTYQVIVIDSLGCQDTSAVFVDNITGIVEQPTKFSVSIYPNPTSGHFTIDAFSLSKLNVEVVDLLGKRIAFQSAIENKHDIDLTGESPGIYLVKISSENQLVTKKVVVR